VGNPLIQLSDNEQDQQGVPQSSASRAHTAQNLNRSANPRKSHCWYLFPCFFLFWHVSVISSLYTRLKRPTGMMCRSRRTETNYQDRGTYRNVRTTEYGTQYFTSNLVIFTARTQQANEGRKTNLLSLLTPSYVLSTR